MPTTYATNQLRRNPPLRKQGQRSGESTQPRGNGKPSYKHREEHVYEEEEYLTQRPRANSTRPRPRTPSRTNTQALRRTRSISRPRSTQSSQRGRSTSLGRSVSRGRSASTGRNRSNSRPSTTKGPRTARVSNNGNRRNRSNTRLPSRPLFRPGSARRNVRGTDRRGALTRKPGQGNKIKYRRVQQPPKPAPRTNAQQRATQSGLRAPKSTDELSNIWHGTSYPTVTDDWSVSTVEDVYAANYQRLKARNDPDYNGILQRVIRDDPISLYALADLSRSIRARRYNGLHAIQQSLIRPNKHAGQKYVVLRIGSDDWDAYREENGHKPIEHDEAIEANIQYTIGNTTHHELCHIFRTTGRWAAVFFPNRDPPPEAKNNTEKFAATHTFVAATGSRRHRVLDKPPPPPKSDSGLTTQTSVDTTHEDDIIPLDDTHNVTTHEFVPARQVSD